MGTNLEPLDNNATERALRGVVIGLAGVEPKAYPRAAVLAALRGDPARLPHEIAATPA